MLDLLYHMDDGVQHDNVVHKVVVLVFVRNDYARSQVMDHCYIFVHDMVCVFHMHMVNDNQVIELDHIVLRYEVYEVFVQGLYKKKLVVEERLEDVDDVVLRQEGLVSILVLELSVLKFSMKIILCK
jgi:hypothetical protein